MTSTIAVAHRGRNERTDTCVRAVSRERSVNHEVNDAELLAAALSGDAAAWELMVARHTPYLRSLAAGYRIGDEGRDAVQTTFLRLFERGGSIRDPRALKGWLRTTLHHECLAVIRRRSRETSVPEPQSWEDLLPPSEAVSEQRLVREEEAGMVRDAVASLPARQQLLITLLQDPDEPGYRDIGDRLGIPVGSIGPTRQRTLRRLRGILATQGLDQCA